MKKNLLIVASVIITYVTFGQNVAINSTGAAANASAALDVDMANKGILIPRVALTTTTAYAPVTGAATTSLMVYNTATAGAGSTAVTPGYYYWDGSKWVRLLGTGNAWELLGNAGTVATTNFIGTTDAVDFVGRTNNIERFRVTSAGRMGIAVTNPTTSTLEVASTTGEAIWGHSSNVGGYLGRETNIVFGTPAQTLQGAGVYAGNPASGYTSSYSQSTGLADVAANISYSSVWIASYNYVDNASATFNPAASYNQLSISNAALGGSQIALRGFSDRGTLAGNPGVTIGVQGIANTQNQDAFGVQGLAYTNSGLRAGGYFESINYAGTSQAFAYVGSTAGGVARKITGTNAVSEIIPTKEHGRITLTAPESPEYWYQDYGTVTLVNGKAHVELDPILADIIVVNEDYPIRAFFTPVDLIEYNGVAMINKTETGFDLVEINGGTHNGKLDYQLVVKPKTGFGEGRFPQAPGPANLKPELEPKEAKAKNQVNPENVFYWPADHEVYNYDPSDLYPIGSFIPAGKNAGKYKVAEGVFMDHIPAQQPKK